MPPRQRLAGTLTVAADLLQEGRVMAHDEHRRARQPLQVILQPRNGLAVQVVGRLVQQQDVGIDQDGLPLTLYECVLIMEL